MSTAQETLYIKIDRNIVVKNRQVTLADIAKMECRNQAILRQLKQKKIYSFSEENQTTNEIRNKTSQRSTTDAQKSSSQKQHKKNQLAVFSVLKIMELIHEDYPNLTISNEGESDFIIEYVSGMEAPGWLNCLKTVALSIIIFFGAAFSIMAFNNDVGVADVFEKFYVQVMGSKPYGVTELEVCYCIGLGLGITIFFNHIGHKKITHDPTPLQIELRKYEQDVDTTFIENAGRRGHNVDVD